MKKTESFIIDNELKKEDLVDIIKSIDKDDYYRGPMKDDKGSINRHKPVWIFKKYWEEMILYIKIKIFVTNRKIYLLSIHEDEQRR